MDQVLLFLDLKTTDLHGKSWTSGEDTSYYNRLTKRILRVGQPFTSHRHIQKCQAAAVGQRCHLATVNTTQELAPRSNQTVQVHFMFQNDSIRRPRSPHLSNVCIDSAAQPVHELVQHGRPCAFVAWYQHYHSVCPRDHGHPGCRFPAASSATF